MRQATKTTKTQRIPPYSTRRLSSPKRKRVSMDDESFRGIATEDLTCTQRDFVDSPLGVYCARVTSQRAFAAVLAIFNGRDTTTC